MPRLKGAAGLGKHESDHHGPGVFFPGLRSPAHTSWSPRLEPFEDDVQLLTHRARFAQSRTTTECTKNPARFLGPDESVDSNSSVYWMFRVNVVECLKLPLVPVMVKVRVPRVALLLTCTLSVDVPDRVTELGLNVAVTREPCPLTLKLTVPVNPFTAPMVTVD